jgi:hypothetical protein
MSKFMHVCGIIFAAIGLALAVLSVASPSQLAIYGLTAETAAILLVGGVLSVGIGGLISQLAQGVPAQASVAAPERAAYSPPSAPDYSPFKRRTDDMVSGIGKVGAAAAGTAVVAGAAANDTKVASSASVAETIEALEQAKSDIKAALGEKRDDVKVPELIQDRVSENVPTKVSEALSDVETDFNTEPAMPAKFDLLPVKLNTPTPVAESTEEPDEAAENEEPAATEEPGLYVVEEQIVRGKPARILSDGTVEAETDEGWMRFENMEHLNEYLDSLT